MKTIRPRRDVDHQLVLTTLALLALDYPAARHVIRGLVVTLYGVRALHTVDTIRQQFNPAPRAVLTCK